MQDLGWQWQEKFNNKCEIVDKKWVEFNLGFQSINLSVSDLKLVKRNIYLFDLLLNRVRTVIVKSNNVFR